MRWCRVLCNLHRHRNCRSTIHRQSSLLSNTTLGASSSSLMSIGGGALWMSQRHRSFHFYLNLEDPAETRLRVEEDLQRLADENKVDSTAYLHSLLNLSLSHYQAADYIQAREVAVLTHDKALAHNKNSSLVYLTAKTCARCSLALAEVYEAHVKRMEEDGQRTSALMPKSSVVFSAQRAIRKLREDAARFDGIANRLYDKPEMAFMRGNGYSCRTKTNQKQRAGYRGKTAWNEDANQVDEEYEAHYGQRWQARRTRPEHVELKRHQQNVCGTAWKVPK